MYFVLDVWVKIRTGKTGKPWAPFLVSPGCVIYLSRILTSNTISPPASTPFISHCCRLFIILQIQLLSFSLLQAYYRALLSLLLSFFIPQQLHTSSDSPSNLVCQTCLQLGSHLALLWLVYFDLIKMHPSRTLGTLLTARLTEPLISAVFSHCFLSMPETTSSFNYNKQPKISPSKPPFESLLGLNYHVPIFTFFNQAGI